MAIFEIAVKQISINIATIGEVESHGECEINGHYLDIKIAPVQKAKSYILEVTYVVADSTRKVRIEVEVV